MEKVVVDLLLSDFRQWTACVYMAESVKVLPGKYQQMMDVHEWDLRTLEGVTRFKEIGGKSLPSIAMDGIVVYSSIIPGQEDLGREIHRRFREKNL